MRLLARAMIIGLALAACGQPVASHGSAENPVNGYIYGNVVGITDGDTLTLLTPEKKQVKIRLAEIDTPERGQPYGSKARQALADLTFQKDVAVLYVDTDRYGRTIGRIYVGQVDVSAELVHSGAAWVYRQYSTDPSLLDLEKEAKAAKRGLWGLPEAEKVPPWQWRSSKRKPSKTTTINAKPFTCGTKTYCREMTSCKEAYFYLKECGLTRLDGDGDGIPCEMLCR